MASITEPKDVPFKEEADSKLEALAAKQAEFGALGYLEKAALLDELLEAMRGMQADFQNMGDELCVSQGWETGNGADAAEWAIPQLGIVDYVTGFVTNFKLTLESMAKTGQPPAPKVSKQRENGQHVVEVFPRHSTDRFRNIAKWKGEVWMQPGKEPSQGAVLEQKPRPNSVALVLQAGNMDALGIKDCIDLLFVRSTVVLYKIHGIRGYHERYARMVFAPLIKRGYLETIRERNGVEDSKYLTNHSLLCKIHMTGSVETHDCIVWGPKEQREARRKENRPLLDLNKVEMTSELGCITPHMVCPGKWSEKELNFHAEHVAVALRTNNGCYCNSPKVLILAEEWEQRDKFLELMNAAIAKLPSVPPYYPGSHQRYQGFEKVYGDKMQRIEGPGFGKNPKFGDHIPVTVINRLSIDPENMEACKDEYAFRNEPFCPIITVVTLKGVRDAARYLEVVPTLCNKYILGRLSCTLVVHPTTEKQDAVAVDKAIAALEYGHVVMNSWTAYIVAMQCSVWGGFGGGDPKLETVEHVESGVGFINNCLLFDHVEKGVSYCPFMDCQATLHGRRLTRELATNVVNMTLNPGIKSLLKLLFPRLFCCA